MNENIKITALNIVLSAVQNFLGRSRSHTYSESKSAVQDSAMLGCRQPTVSERKPIITNKLRGFVGIVASLKWLHQRMLIGLIAVDGVWLMIIGTGIKQKITGIGKVGLQRSIVVTVYTLVIKIGERQYLKGMIMLAKCVGQIKVGF